MSTILQDDQFFNNEVDFCRLYSYEAKKYLEDIFLKNRVSYFEEWQSKSFLQKLFKQGYSKKKPLCTIRINLADVERAYKYTQGIAEIKYTDEVSKFVIEDDNRNFVDASISQNDMRKSFFYHEKVSEAESSLESELAKQEAALHNEINGRKDLLQNTDDQGSEADNSVEAAQK